MKIILRERIRLLKHDQKMYGGEFISDWSSYGLSLIILNVVIFCLFIL